MQYKPAVFAVGDEYQILIPVVAPSLMWIKVGDRCYYDHAAGVLRSKCRVHRVHVPMQALDEAGCYTVCERLLPHRRPYCSKPRPEMQTSFRFYPVPKENARAYMIADAHNRVREPILAAQAFGDFDFLIFNGDVPEYSEKMDCLMTVFAIADALTAGEKPLLYSRGNHDLRGKYAEDYAEYVPNCGGSFYYPFHLGSVAGLILDCGEDKTDDHEEYGGTLSCHVMREEETHYLESFDPVQFAGAQTRLVIVHSPFTTHFGDPFDIEQDMYAHWGKLLRDRMHPDAMLCGHLHTLGIHACGSDFDSLGQPCTVIVGSKPGKAYFAGTGLLFGKDGIEVSFTDSDGKTLRNEIIETRRG
ncbi:MAG: metallophosphoesterase [Clostridia bacterium]|nr:metallophosphoesterase [Clostridia bacterium]